VKLHLGCGLRYMDGYINIDQPDCEHTVQAGLRADVYADITQLSYPANSVDEIRLHHVFEHFDRPVALALVCRWRDWLKPGGLLRIETPDSLACFRFLVSPFRLFDKKQQVMRHVFGSHEAAWAAHRDGWYREKFRVTLTTLGFTKLRFKRNHWGSLKNIEVRARKSDEEISPSRYYQLARRVLVLSTIRVKTACPDIPEGSELGLLGVWMKLWQQAYDR
jgi:predicted SAM-dependent methyltransferase